MAKLLGARVAWANADNALQIHGGNGFALEYQISRVLCDARILNIFEGAAEIQAQVIARRLLEGWHDLTTRLLPAMHQQRAGRIVQCSSVLGFMAAPYRGAYNASKFALEGLTDTLRLELHGSGIHVSSIQPGPIRSRFTLHALNALKANIDHENSRNKALYQKRIAELEEIAGDKPAQLETPEQSARITGKGWKPVYRLGPDAVLDCLIHATESANPKPYYRVTYTTKLASLARRFLPDRLQYKLMLRSS
jgi:NAD(P)-dependent dehydrogenase (short-subunit alcohol dehydrogenase family)